MEHLDVNISIWRICMTATLQAAVHLGIDYAENLHSAKNQPKRTVQQLFNVTSKLIKDQKEIQGIFGKGQLFILARQFSYQMQVPECSPTQYCVWEGSVKIPSKHGRRRLIGFRINFKKENWIESMESRWSSSGQISQGSLHCRSSPRFKSWWLNQSVNLSKSKDGLSSCQCATTLYGEKKETMNCVLRIPSMLKNIQEDTRQVIGRFLGQLRKAVVRRSRIQTKWRMGQSRWYYDDEFTVKADILLFEDPVLLEEET